MKVFLSWSGHKSHQVALVLRDWLPSVIQSIMPYVSSEDIDKGARWSTDIAKELEDSTYGILCVTKDNIEAPWLLFEAGALSKMMDKSSVCPFIFDLKRAEVKGPILQFQSTIFEKEDVKKLMLSLNKACGEANLKDDLLIKSFDVWWPKLEEALSSIKDEKPEEKEGSKDKNLKNDILEEILDLTRANQKILRSPDILLPIDYFEFLYRERISRIGVENERERELQNEQLHLNREIVHRMRQLRDFVEMYYSSSKQVDEEFYMTFKHLIDLFQHNQMLLDKNEQILVRRKKAL